MRPMIDELELPQVQEIRTRDRRALAEHRVIGMDGSLLQNLGRGATGLALWGIASGPRARGFLEELGRKFRDGNPVAFTADIIAATEIVEMTIAALKTRELAGRPERFAYLLTLREHVEPPRPEDTSFLDDELLEDATGLMDDLVSGLDGLEMVLDFMTGLERFIPVLGTVRDRLREKT